MQLNNIFNNILLLGWVQGFVVSILLFLDRENRLSNRFLSLLLFLMSLASVNVYLLNIHFFDNIPNGNVFQEIFPFVIIMPVGPLIYFYIQSVTNPSFAFVRKNLWHFMPIIVDLFPHLVILGFVIYILTGHQPSNLPALGKFIDDYNIYSDIPRWFSVSIYVYLCARQLQKLPHSGSKSQKSAVFPWLWHFIKAFSVFQIIWLIYLVPYAIPKYTDFLLQTFWWYPVYVPMAVLIYWLGVKGYGLSQRTVSRKSRPSRTQEIPSSIIKQTIVSLKNAMEKEKLYQKPDLNLSLLAAQTGLNAKIISAVLNQYMHKSFNEFVNEYRIAEIKERLLLPENRDLTIAGLAYECGFNSQPTFQRAFKSILGVSPTEFLGKHMNDGL